MALKTDEKEGLFQSLATIAMHCIPTNASVFLDIITTNNTTCSIIENKVYVKVPSFNCKNALRLIPCKLIEVWSESTCKMGCQCKGDDKPCQIWIQTTYDKHANICEIMADNTNMLNVSAS